MGAIFGFSGAPDPDLLRRMSATLAHRGERGASHSEHPRDGTVACRGLWEDPVARKLGSGLCVDGDQAIALAGYLTNGASLARNRPPDGAPDRTRDGDLLSALLRSYRDHGIAFVSQLRGAFVLVVRDRGVIHLARDGAGVRTVHYAKCEGRFLFASEPKGILAMPGFRRRIRPAAVAQYLTFSFVPGAGTMLEDLHELPAGHWVSCGTNGDVSTHRYFRFEETQAEPERGEDHWVQRLREETAQAVRERLPANEPVGVFLSGGLDSSIVTAEVARQHGKRVKTYAIHFGKQYPHELDFARAVAQRCGTEHEEVLIRPKDFLPRLRRMIWHLDEPIGDPITQPNFELSARVARDVRWVFNGEGGDPIFGGPKNLPMLLHHWYGVPRESNFRERRYLASYRRGYEEIARLLLPEFRRELDVRRDLEAILTPFFTATHPTTFLNKLMALNIRLKGAHLILPKVERMTGAWGLTALAPLCDERLIRSSFEMPPRLKLGNASEKRILKLAYRDLLPPEVLARPKSGMRVPVHFWFQGEMRRYARKILSPRAIRAAGIFDPARVKQLLDYDTEEGPGRFGLRIWMLITFEIWRRIVVEGEPL